MPQADQTDATTAKRCVYRIADLELDRGAGVVRRDGSALPLPCLSWRLLLALVDAAPAVLSQEELLERVWEGRVVSSETVTQRVKLLREALGDDASAPRYVGLVRGRGYRLLPEVTLRPRNTPARAVTAMPRPLVAGGALLLLVAAIGLGVPADRTDETASTPGEASPPDATPPMTAPAAHVTRADEAFQKGRHYYNRRRPGDFMRAREQLHTAVTLHPLHADAWVALAASYYIAHYAQGELEERYALEEALAALRRALELDPTHARAHARMGHVLQTIGEPVSAARHYRLARLHGDDDALVHAITAGRFIDIGDYDQALTILRRATQLEPLTPAFRANLVAVSLSAGLLAVAEHELAEYHYLFPEQSRQLNWERGVLMLLRSQHEQALLTAQHAGKPEERLALTAMAAAGAGKSDVARQALAQLGSRQGLLALLFRIQVHAYLGNDANTRGLLEELAQLCDSGQLNREARRWAWSELALSPLGTELLRAPARARLRHRHAVAMVDS